METQANFGENGFVQIRGYADQHTHKLAGQMLTNIRAFLRDHPYGTSIFVASIWNFFWLTSLPPQAGLTGFILSGLIVGFIIGFMRIAQWMDLFKKFGIALGCYAVVAFFYGFFGLATETSAGDQGGMVFFVMPVVTIIASPLLLVGEFVGWLGSKLVKPAN